ncbi:EscJ/YscJ/HrcJ family type III secretion inner membrane ring protein [Bradyrhizobium sp. CSA112]|uniref:type III secretion system inner membrane ring lipoprotein SctJ n=1 Tax=Bradyrhizobium sp. CSA112 TaxID=2699170 RepID=UPI0023B1B015|nr:type III secretion inner membrane ring lipoprotein SctJ [Bradyrhizobium sp. CSA112]MDE5454001.1 EscJ/YscJ/HrcJ family type III secretion inner membrane ring protein [Bradyrhizobium sp. CSA112]
MIAVHKMVKLAALALVLCALAGCQTELYSKLDEREANDMIALLHKYGVAAERSFAKDGTSQISVEERQLPQAIELLKANGLPRRTFTNMGEVFKSSGLISSPTEERARFIYALSEELSRTISDIDGVLSARIHVVLPKNDLLRQDATPSSASVFIRHDSRAPLKSLLPHVKMLVANSIEGLSYEKVSVVLVPVERPSIEPAAPGTVGAATPAGLMAPRTAGGSSQALYLSLAALPALLLTGALAFWLGRRHERHAPGGLSPVPGAARNDPPRINRLSPNDRDADRTVTQRAA